MSVMPWVLQAFLNALTVSAVFMLFVSLGEDVCLTGKEMRDQLEGDFRGDPVRTYVIDNMTYGMFI